MKRKCKCNAVYTAPKRSQKESYTVYERRMFHCIPLLHHQRVRISDEKATVVANELSQVSWDY